MNQKLYTMRKILVALVLIAAVEVFSSCEKYSFAPPAVNPNQTVHFQADIQPIFISNCVDCHGATRAPDLRNGKSYLALTKGKFVTPPGETSKLYHQMITNSEHISRSTDGEKLKVLLWINQGALNN
jgi:hypothetical protein